MRKSFVSPELAVVSFEIEDKILASNGPENYSGYIDGPGDWPPDVSIDPGEEIEW